jgi:hypothetical protein
MGRLLNPRRKMNLGNQSWGTIISENWKIDGLLERIFNGLQNYFTANRNEVLGFLL